MKLFFNLTFAAIAVLGVGTTQSLAQGPTGVVVADGLNTPWGITSFNTLLYVSESGAGQVVSINPAATDKPPVPIITGFPTKPFATSYQVGPLGLAFLDKDNFFVGGADAGLGEDVVRVFALPAVDKVLKIEDAKAKLGPIAKSDQSKTGEGRYFSVVASTSAIFTLGQGDPEQGWISKSDVTTDKKIGELKPLFAANKAIGAPGAFAITLNKQGAMVVASAGEFGKPSDSTFTFCHSRTGKKLLHLKSDLNDVVDLSYSPKTGRLYAVDFSQGDPQHAGIYRIDDDGLERVKTLKILELDRPTSCSFATDGTLYVTILGALPGSTAKPGQVIKIVGL